MAESGLAPGRALLGHQRARFAQRLLARPKDGQGPEEILSCEETALTTRPRAATGTRPGETTYGSRPGSGKVGAACAWRRPEGWACYRYHLGNNKEEFGTETYTIFRALKVLD